MQRGNSLPGCEGLQKIDRHLSECEFTLLLPRLGVELSYLPPSRKEETIATSLKRYQDIIQFSLQ